MSSRDPRFMLGYTPIPFDKLEQSCDFIQKWITFHMPSIELKRYPEDVIFKNGHQIFEFQRFLTGDKPNFKVNFRKI